MIQPGGSALIWILLFYLFFLSFANKIHVRRNNAMPVIQAMDFKLGHYQPGR
jgi:uncharacterized membrane protein